MKRVPEMGFRGSKELEANFWGVSHAALTGATEDENTPPSKGDSSRASEREGDVPTTGNLDDPRRLATTVALPPPPLLRGTFWGACMLLVLFFVLFTFISINGAGRPRYGGILRVKTDATVGSLNPTQWPKLPAEQAIAERMAPMIFERLVRLDSAGDPLPRLALGWDHNSNMSRWSFRIRPGVRFHDGTLMTPAAVVTPLISVLKGSKLSASGETVVIQSGRPLPHLLYQLAKPQSSIFLRGSDGKLSGTGPFRLIAWEPRRRASLAAHDDYWDGRPFLDLVEVEMNRPLREQLLDLELGKADVVDLPANQVRSAAQRGLRVWSSAPVELMALCFRRDRPLTQNAGLREALALSIDRSTMHNVLLQKQGELAGSLLPQELSGHAFLFPARRNLDRAKALIPAARPTVPPLQLSYEANDLLARTIAERIALNAREAGILLRPAAAVPATERHSLSAGFDLSLLKARISSTPPGDALVELAATLSLPGASQAVIAKSPEALYVVEQMLLKDHWVIPLFHLPVSYGLSPHVMTASPQGFAALRAWKLDEWNFEDLWLEGANRTEVRGKP